MKAKDAHRIKRYQSVLNAWALLERVDTVEARHATLTKATADLRKWLMKEQEELEALLED